ncbi:MAG: putative 4-hydroxy-4-methyl-2-oxoglutarate aldolase [Xanthomonadales bacterium]|nr:putative 4-hydroxy-4-methyl-2-oxoglutarate aldolase [Xanthomonadales bacterium]NIN58786.1 putative 4-hydroxy-4-methyl-2-oxoglutarate aldolase [Xanthomonadales bacterium]NIN74054.1 putative 4-hydroxy-4-methyl-2-oxoglutarate aldolase [Xanthomonadales bacterium]NIO13804.1 putative 4-hydroxy-4-methyl-2-oxoglutarate aldolase [Xanthomonadales bacterium]NIP11179.1 putative 4-hydroxy-4-methyl-2-oxoglutarate aldolase [Xanthomonadales bacterium]
MTASVPDICDARPDAVRIVEPVFRDYGGATRFGGEVVTISCFEDNSRVKEMLARDGAGNVLVVDGGGSLRCALLGDMLAALARDNGWRGVVVNGCVRDVEILATIEIGVRALNVHPRRSEKRGEGRVNEPVHFAGVTFEPQQFLYADRNGMVVLASRLEPDADWG